MTGQELDELFGGPPRNPGSHDHPARNGSGGLHPESHRGGRPAHGAARARNSPARAYLCLAGGVALNCVANGELLREGIFDDIWIQPAAGDAGGALGAAPVRPSPIARKPARNQRLGRRCAAHCSARIFSNEEIRAFLDGRGNSATISSPTKRELLKHHRRGHGSPARWSAGSTGGWSSARARSARAASSAMPATRRCRRTMNLRIKFRECFRPVRAVRAGGGREPVF